MATNTSANAVHLSINPFDTSPAFIQADLLQGLKRQSKPNVTPSADPSPANSAPHVTFSPGNAVKRRGLQAHGMTAEAVQGIDREEVEAHFRSPYHTLIAYERGSRTDGMTVMEGLPPSSVQDLTHKLVFVPAGTEYSDRYIPRVNLSVVYFQFAPGIVARDARQGAVPLSPRLFFDNPSLWASVQKLKEMLEDPAFEDQPYFEALGLLLAHEVTHANPESSASQPLARGGLAPWQQRIVTGYIEEHLTETIPLAKLAGLVRLSPYYFCRAFKQSLGVPPHRFHINRRIEQAKRMLLERDQSVTHIGLALGFSETSSFSAAFRKVTGTTPTSFQRSAV
jgi:AraC family transcriptional regulator